VKEEKEEDEESALPNRAEKLAIDGITCSRRRKSDEDRHDENYDEGDFAGRGGKEKDRLFAKWGPVQVYDDYHYHSLPERERPVEKRPCGKRRRFWCS